MKQLATCLLRMFNRMEEAYNNNAFSERKTMDNLYNADIAYALLVIGFIFALLAIVTPGTGVIEIVALALLALAGIAIYQLSFNPWALIILLLSVVPFVYAIRKPKREWALALSILGFIVGSLYIFPTSGLLPAVNPFLAVGFSLIVAVFLWFTVRKVVAAYGTRPLQDLHKLVGLVGQAKTAIQEEGTVQVAGELWSAHSEKLIPAGSRVHVLSREGFMLVVEPEDQPKE
jgi:membrane-bound serine protease (ClpP class)